MPRRTIAGSRALITGASSGIGRELALALGRAGANLLLLARRESRLREVASALQREGHHAEILAGDITDPEVRQQAMALCNDRLGGLDLLVNNAGVGALGYFYDADPERLRRIMEVNFFALVETTRLAIPLLRGSDRATIVNVSSVLGHRGVPRMTEYCASKFAVQGFSESLRAELAHLGIHVLVVSPGTTETEFSDHLIERRTPAIWPDRPSTSAEAVARATVRAIVRRRHEVIPSFSGRLLCWLNRLSPRLTDAAILWAERRNLGKSSTDS